MCLIDGRWIQAISKGTTTVINKANADCIDMDSRDAKLAISAADNAFKGVWSTFDVKTRSKLLQNIASALQREKYNLAEIITLENGKPLRDAKAEIDFSAEYFEWYAALTLQLAGRIAPSMVPNVSNLIVKEPVGVCALITPWNFPGMMIARKLAPALGAGCTAVIKASVECPLTTLALCRLIESVGIPPGVINVLTSSKENEADIGLELCQNDQVRKL
jgi:succinate-semialdehyde dehydrogenase/glutarate-semialdehyde dehydrogenase